MYFWQRQFLLYTTLYPGPRSGPMQARRIGHSGCFPVIQSSLTLHCIVHHSLQTHYNTASIINWFRKSPVSSPWHATVKKRHTVCYRIILCSQDCNSLAPGRPKVTKAMVINHVGICCYDCYLSYWKVRLDTTAGQADRTLHYASVAVSVNNYVLGLLYLCGPSAEAGGVNLTQIILTSHCSHQSWCRLLVLTVFCPAWPGTERVSFASPVKHFAKTCRPTV